MPIPAKTAVVFIVFGLSLISPFAMAEDPDVELGNERQTDEAIAYFEKHIRPLFAQRCYQCHSEQANEREGDLLLDRRSGWMSGGERGPSVIAGDIEASLLVQAVRYTDPDLEMPPSEPLSPVEIERIEHWVRMGAPGPRDGQVATVNQPSDPIAGKQHWAFQPLAPAVLPQVNNVAWTRSPIDQFVLAGLEHAGLQPVADASPRELARRLSFQLVGLPPNQRMVSALEAADSDPVSAENIVEETVDRLLASPQFGQRWGRHWLDLARYADSNGLDENFLFREAWRYRNWVIDSINADLPVDRFLTEQIAGDLLPYDSIEQRDQQRIAAGFLVLGPKVLLGAAPEQQRMDVADEHIDTLGRAILGQTLGCARCHDHKFDPVPTADYYALAGIFTSTRVMEKRHMLNQQRVMEQLIGLGENGDDRNGAYEEYWRKLPDIKKRMGTAEEVLKSLEANDADQFAKHLEKNRDAVAEIAIDETTAIEERIAAQQRLVAELKQTIDQPVKIPPRAMIPREVEQPANEAIRLAGQPEALGDEVPRGFLTVLNNSSTPTIAAGRSGRLELAQWLTNGESPSGQLAARVLANRVWQQMIGRGIVRTVDNFGRTGEAPTHPELLDYLADRLIDSGWSIKHLVREIALSRTFALSSQYDSESYAQDPDNQLLWRAHRRRLEPESLRDAMLVAAGGLDQAHYDSTVDYLGDQATAVGKNKVRRRTDFPCRSVYLPVIRNDLPEIFESFDFANPHTTTGARPKTIVPSQGLFMLNDEFVMSTAEATAQRILAESPTDDTNAQVDLLFELVCNAVPTEDERGAIVGFLQRTELSLHSQSNNSEVVEDFKLRAWALACHALFASSRFQFVE